ncbi:hypothetical protein ACHAW5_008485, partial [Stephanodiscus triporus]
VGAAAWRGGG